MAFWLNSAIKASGDCSSGGGGLGVGTEGLFEGVGDCVETMGEGNRVGWRRYECGEVFVVDNVESHGLERMGGITMVLFRLGGTAAAIA